MSKLRNNEVLGLVYQFVGASCIGAGIYYSVWAAVRSIFYRKLLTPSGWEYLLFPFFFGIGAVLYSFGSIEIKEVPPSHKVHERNINKARTDAKRFIKKRH